jgi:hypothetical protein
MPTEVIERPSGFYVSLALEALTVAFALWTGLLYQQLLLHGGTLAGIAAVATVFALCFALGLYLTKSAVRRAAVIVCSSLGFFAFSMYGGNIPFAAVAVAVTLLLLFWGEVLARARVANAVYVRFLHDTRPLLTKLATALVAGGLILFIPSWTPARAFLSESSFGAMLQLATGVVGRLYQEIRFTGTLQDFQVSLARYQLSKTAEFRKLPAPRQEEEVRILTERLRPELHKALQIGPSDEALPLQHILYNVSLRTIGNLQTQFGSSFLAVWLITLFLALRAAGMVLAWVAGVGAHLVFHALLVANVIRFRGETQTQEVVEYV